MLESGCDDIQDSQSLPPTIGIDKDCINQNCIQQNLPAYPSCVQAARICLSLKWQDLLASRGCGSESFVYHAMYADEAVEATPILRISAARNSKDYGSRAGAMMSRQSGAAAYDSVRQLA